MTFLADYVGRFAPSPTGPLHAGSLACLLASYLDAKAHYGRWLIRIEDIDPAREPEHCAQQQLELMEKLQVHSDGPILFQSDRNDAYEKRLAELQKKGLVYGCACSRKSIEEQDLRLNLPKGVYPGTCRGGTHGKPVRALRFLTRSHPVVFTDRLCGTFMQNVEREVGDIVLKRADGLWAYQLAVVTDDAYQGVTHIVRGQDLLDNTPRQILLQRALGVRTPEYMHIPLVTHEDGQKLSKQNGAKAVDAENLEAETAKAWKHLGFEAFDFDTLPEFYAEATKCWRSYLSGKKY